MERTDEELGFYMLTLGEVKWVLCYQSKNDYFRILLWNLKLCSHKSTLFSSSVPFSVPFLKSIFLTFKNTSLSYIRMSPTICRQTLALLTATIDLRRSFAYGDGFLLTREKIMASFSRPWYSSTVKTPTFSLLLIKELWMMFYCFLYSVKTVISVLLCLFNSFLTSSITYLTSSMFRSSLNWPRT